MVVIELKCIKYNHNHHRTLYIRIDLTIKKINMYNIIKQFNKTENIMNNQNNLKMDKLKLNTMETSTKKDKNIDYLLRELSTIEIFDTDVESIFNLEYLEKCIESLESHEYHIERSITSIKERIRKIEYIYESEKEIEENLIKIEELECFINYVCETDEDKEEPLSEIEELLEENEELNDEISEFYKNV